MSKRNLILIIVILILVGAGAIGLYYFYKPASNVGQNTEGPNFLADFFPFGDNKPSDIPAQVTPPTDVSGFVPEIDIPSSQERLRKVSSFPIAGFGVFLKERFKNIAPPALDPEEETSPITNSTKPVSPPTEFVPSLRYVEKTTGNIYQTFADSIDERKFSSTLIPRVREAYFGNKGESILMRYLKEDNKTIETFFGTLPKEFLGADSAGTNEIKGSFLPQGISDISISPDALKAFYIFNVGDRAVGVTLSMQTGTKIQIFDSPFTEWLSQWPNSKLITITTKPSADVAGFVYAINPEKKDLGKIFGGINGLTTLTNPEGGKVLYSNNNLSLNVYDIATGSSILLGVKTLAEKCTWAGNEIVYCAVPKFTNQGQFPDPWYQGEVSFEDEIWKIDTKNQNTIKIIDPITVQGGERIDATKLAVDENQNYLFFVNKKDSYLWKLNLK